MPPSKKKSTGKKSKKNSDNSKKAVIKTPDLFSFVPKKVEKKEKTKQPVKTSKKSEKKSKVGKKEPINKTTKEEKPISIKSAIVKKEAQNEQELKEDILKTTEIESVNRIPGKPLKKSDLIFFSKDDKPFGELAFEKILPKEKSKGSEKSKYLSTLIENDKICKNMEQGLLLTVEYCGVQNKAYARFYDLDDHKIKFWIDTTNHRPYCLSKQSNEELEKNIELKEFSGFDSIEEVEKIDLLEDKKIKMSKIYGKTPTDVGGSGSNNIKSILGEDGAWEAKIRYHHNYIYDEQLIPGLIYSIKDEKLKQVEYKIQPEIEKEFLQRYKSEKEEFREMAKKYLKIFSYPIPDIRRVAFDIEVSVPKDGNLPNTKLAKEEVISISFSASDGLNRVYVLWRDGVPIGQPLIDFPEDAEIFFFETEKELIEETFRIIWDYPLVISFNGDNFDFNYLFHRAKKLKIKDELNPIQIQRGGTGMVGSYAYLKYGVHLDLYQIFANRSLKGYAFGGAYDRNSLDHITKAFLDERKFKHETGEKFSAVDIAKMDLHILAHYNMLDSVITLDLTKFGDNSVWNLIVYLLRITKMPLQDMFRHQISSWIRSIIFFEHRARNFLIPRISEITKKKPGGFAQSVIEGKGFQGAYVIPPVPGRHFEVVVADFSSLYPSIIKTRNLSYETVNCTHPECEANLLPDTPYYACTKRVGILSLVVGFLRDIRVNWFKPRSSDKNLPKNERTFAKILQSALKVFINGCLPYEEEIILKDTMGKITKKKIGEIEDKWQGYKILSIDRNEKSFGNPIFVNLKGFKKRLADKLLKIRLSDGRIIKCTENHIIPKYIEKSNTIDTLAKDLKVNDEILVFHNIPMNEDVPNHIFLPRFLDDEEIWLGLKRETYKKYSYRKNQETENEFIKTINEKFHYSKSSKMYKSKVKNLNHLEINILENFALSNGSKIYLKKDEKLGHWYNSILNLKADFFRLLGWYVSEGSLDKNRIAISQSLKINPENFNSIIKLIKKLDLPFSADNKKTIRINSNIYALLIEKLCSKLSYNKKIPFELMNKERILAFLETYYLGDGNLKKNKWKRYSTNSLQLKNDLITILGATGKFASIYDMNGKNSVYRIIETEGKKYKRKNKGMVNFNGTTPVKIKSIELLQYDGHVFDIETENGWFVSTNGIIVHNSYGVFGSTQFPLFCLPVAEATTAIGRYAIKSTIDKAESMGIQVLYGDTDSVFLANPSKKQIKEIVDWSSRELNIDLEEEKTYQFLALSERKKNYVGIYKGSLYVDIKGMTGKKSNTPPFIKQAFTDVTKILKNIKNQDDFNQSRKEIISVIKGYMKRIGRPIEKDGIPIEDYSISVRLTKPIDKYAKIESQHVKAAKMEMMNTDSKIEKGDIITFVKTKDTNGVKPLSMATIQDVDRKKYIELLKGTFEQILDPLDISFTEIEGTKRIDSFF